MNRVTIQQLKDAERCPGWLAAAQTKDAIVSIDEYHRITWHKGIWEDGVWRGKTWEDGIWKGGIWKDGTWVKGVWEEGWWGNGVWKGGIWKDGTWVDGCMYAGTIEGGDFPYEGISAPLHRASSVVMPVSWWSMTYFPGSDKLSIGCETRTLSEWDFFFSKSCKEVITTPRNSFLFKKIRDHYCALIKQIIIKIKESELCIKK